MFKTMRRQLDRKQPTGKALVIRRIIISSIFIATFFIFQTIQLGKAEVSLETQISAIEAATATSKENAEAQLRSYEKVFPGAVDKLYTDEAFEQSPLADRIPAAIDYETMTAKQESIQARGTVILFDIFQFVLPGAVNMVQEHDKKIDDFFKSDAYISSVEANAKVQDVTAAIQFCRGTPLAFEDNKRPEGYAEAEGEFLTLEQRQARAKIINEAAERTICSDVPKL